MTLTEEGLQKKMRCQRGVFWFLDAWNI